MADGIILSALLALAALALRVWIRRGGCSGCHRCPHAAGCVSAKHRVSSDGEAEPVDSAKP